MEKIGKWFTIKKRAISETDPIERVRAQAQRTYETTGSLPDFAVYSALEHNNDRREEFVRVIYFSPVAAQFCSTITHSNEFYGGESEAPTGEEEGFRPIVGREDRAWALLK
jgi:hypothetical protein